MARWILICATFLQVLGNGVAAHAELFVICNPGTSLEAGEVADVFLGGKQFSGSTHLVPVDNTAAQEEFLARVLHMTLTKYVALWTKKSFRDGTRQPQIRGDDAATLEFVKRTPGGVGYLHSSSPSGVRTLGKY